MTTHSNEYSEQGSGVFAAPGGGSSTGSLQLDVRNLSVDAPGTCKAIRLVDNVSFQIRRGERVALVGESGSGKSVTARALMRLNRRLAVSGRIDLDGEDVLAMTERQMERIRGKRIGMAFQDAFTSLDPVMRVGDQVMETLIVHGASRADAKSQAVAMLTELGVQDAENRLKAYVHEFSGGMRQRVVLAMALIGQPQLLIADEPTTALDVRIAQQVLDLLDEVATHRNLSVLLITHDMGVVASFADRVIVMYSGRVVEDAEVHALFEQPLHPYTEGLLNAVPRIDRIVEKLVAVPGMPVAPSARPSGCAFHPRCSMATEVCRTAVPELRTFGARKVACHHAELRGAHDAI